MASGFEAFRQAVLADESLQAGLDDTICADTFVLRAQQAAQRLGLSIDGDAFRPRHRRSPAIPGSTWAPRGWLPVALTEAAGELAVDWARFGDAPTDRSFYSDAVATALYRPFNRVLRHATTLDAFVAAAPDQPVAPLDGLVFHMSRCGSTLVAQMLGALDATIALSEPGPLDAVVRLALERPDIPQARHIERMRAMVAALARPRGGERRCFLKLDSWHVLALPLFRAAFPSVPWIYLFRDPAEVLVSQQRMRGYQTVPDLVPAGLYGSALEAGPAMQCAVILAQYHAAAIDALRSGGGVAVDYATLPDAFEQRIAPYFGIRLSGAERMRVAERASRDAKFPDTRFVPDGEAKQRESGAAIGDAVTRHLAGLHAELCGLSRR